MNLDSPLVSLPDLALRKVLEKCGYMGIQSLRKTCHDLRNFIDDSSLELGIQAMIIVLHPQVVSFQYAQKDTEKFSIEYHEVDQSCGITRVYEGGETKEFRVTGQAYRDAFEKDLAAFFQMLDGRKAPLEELRCIKKNRPCVEIPMEEFTVIRNSLKTGKLLKVRRLFLQLSCESEFFNALSLIDPKFIKSLRIVDSFFCMPFGIDEIARLEQWKTVKNLTIIPQVHVENVRPFLHFRDLQILVRGISKADVAALLKRFRSSDPPKSFVVKYASCVDLGIYGVFQKAPITSDGSTTMEWYFKNTTTGNIVNVRANSRNIWLETMESSSVPSDVIVHN